MCARLRVKPTDVPVYNSDDEKFTIEMHYAGKLIYAINDELHYLVGEVRFWDWVDPDVISLFDIDRFLVDVGYLQQHRLDNMEEHRMKEGLAYYSYNENESLRNGLFEIRSNLDLHNMAKDVVKHDKIVKLFLLKTDEVNRAMNNIDPIIESSSDANEGKRSRKGKTYSMLSADGEESDSSYTSGFEEDGNEFSEEELVNVSDHENYVHIMKEREGNKENENTRVVVREEGQRSQDLHIDNDVGHEYNSEYEDSDELESIYSSDEDGQVERRRYPEFQAAKEMDNPSFCVEQTFSDFATLKKAIKNYSLINHRPLRFKHSDPKRLQVVCQTGCPLRIWASKRQDGRVQIKKAELEHSGCVLKYKNSFGDYKYIANKYVQRFQVDPEWSTRSVVQTVQEDLHMNISNSKAWRIRRTANKMVRGKEIEQYARLRDYCAEVRKSNVGSTIFVDTDNDSFFRRMYCCLDACKKGFISGCRKVICLDGCFLKTEYGGQLLSAIGIDANNGIFPIAYAVVRSEDEANWTWFLQTLRSDLNIPVACDEWTFMSDKQKGLMNAVNTIFSTAEHRCCVRHLWTNLQRTLGGTQKTKELFWNAARSSYEAEFTKHMNQLRDCNQPAYQWLVGKPFSQWSRCYFKTLCKSDLLLNNHCESWNRCILRARHKPIISLFDILRCQLMERFRVKGEFALKNWKGSLCPRIQAKLEMIKKASFNCYSVPNGAMTFEVEVDRKRLVVDLNKRTCTCRQRELSGIPCIHATSCIYQVCDFPERYVDKCFEVATYMKSYDFHVSPMVGHESWDRSGIEEVKAPRLRIDPTKKRGRRSTKRKKGREEVNERNSKSGRASKKGTIINCSVCRKPGHNKRKCKERPPTEENGGNEAGQNLQHQQ